MALEDTLRDELRNEIDTEVESIRSRAQQEGEALLQTARQRATEQEEEARLRLAEDCALRRHKALAHGEQEERNALLRLREEEVDRVFTAARRQLASMPEKDPRSYGQLMAGVLENCRRQLPAGPLRVRLGPGLESLGEQLAQDDTVRQEQDKNLFGLIVEAEAGRLHCDGTIPSLLGRLRRERQAELEAMIFGEGSSDE